VIIVRLYRNEVINIRFAIKRKESALKQADVAEKLGVKRSTVSKWETGISRPRTELLPKLADLYGCKL